MDQNLATAATPLIEAWLVQATKHRVHLLEVNGKTRAVKELETTIEEAHKVLRDRAPGMNVAFGYQALKGRDCGRYPGYYNPRLTSGARGRKARKRKEGVQLEQE